MKKEKNRLNDRFKIFFFTNIILIDELLIIKEFYHMTSLFKLYKFYFNVFNKF